MTKEVTLKYTSTDEYWDLKWRLIKKALRAFMWVKCESGTSVGLVERCRFSSRSA